MVAAARRRAAEPRPLQQALRLLQQALRLLLGRTVWAIIARRRAAEPVTGAVLVAGDCAMVAQTAQARRPRNLAAGLPLSSGGRGSLAPMRLLSSFTNF